MLYGVSTKDLRDLEQAIYEVYGTDVNYFVFDEIHNVKGWELFVTRLKETKRIVVTGSNSRMLSGELSTVLTGRHLDLVLFPFSFKEYLRFRGVSEDIPLSTRQCPKCKYFGENIEMETGIILGIRLYLDNL
uniref:ATP-binding protein n=1 Tax=Metallosphaera hakonensis TaxID=79601 RepID=UPI000A5F0819|nr:AAA family ATPase [Metallosphaera hakonensis]